MNEKSSGVTVTERMLAEFCERSFLKLWSYPNPYKDDGGVCQGSCRVSHFLSGLFILSLRVQIYRPDGYPIACAA